MEILSAKGFLVRERPEEPKFLFTSSIQSCSLAEKIILMSRSARLS
jgi:hypothetical protein